MAHTELQKYITDSRTKRVQEEDIKRALLDSGWRIKDVEAALQTLHPPEFDSERAWRYVLFGFSCFLVASGVLLYLFLSKEFVVREIRQVSYILFVLTHLLNGLAAFYTFRAAFRLRPFVLYQLFIGILALIVIAFALLSLAHLIPLALEIGSYSRQFFFDESLHLIITYWILLPLQMVVYALLLTVLGTLYLRRHRSGMPSPQRKLFLALFVFLFMAILAIGDMFMGMDVFDNF